MRIGKSGFLALVALAAVCCLITSFAGAAESGGRVAAVVNKEIITEADVLEHAALALALLNDNLTAAEREEYSKRIRRAAMRRLIERKLLLAEAERRRKKKAAYQRQIARALELRMEELRRAAGGDEALHKNIRRLGMTHSKYVERVREDMICEALINDAVRRNVSVSPAEMFEYYRRNPDLFVEPSQAWYRQIFIRARDEDTRGAAREKAESLAAQLKGGADFAELAIQESDGPHASDGGLWEETRPGARPAPIDKLIFSLPIGDIGGPVETAIGFTIVKVELREAGKRIPFEKAQAQIEQHLVNVRRLQRYEEFVRRLEDENYVEIR